MKQVNRNRLAQLQFSVLTQIIKDKEASKQLAAPIQTRRALFQAIPASVCEHASHVMPDHSVAALETQPITFADVLRWHLQPNGGHLYFSKIPSGDRPLTIAPREDQSVVSSKKGATQQLDFTSNAVKAAVETVRIADQYYTKAVTRLRDGQGTGKEVDDLMVVAREAEKLSTVHDQYALKEMFYLRVRHQVAQEGFNTTDYDKVVKKHRHGLPMVANPANYLRHGEEEDRHAADSTSPGM